MSIILENRLCRNVGLLYLKLILLPTVTEYIPPVLDKTFAIRAENMFWWTLLTWETALTFWVMWSISLVYVCKKMCLRLAEKHMDPLHYTDVIMGTMVSQITSLSIVQLFVQAQIKENIKSSRHWPLWGEFTGYRWIPLTKGQLRGKCLHLITS